MRREERSSALMEQIYRMADWKPPPPPQEQTKDPQEQTEDPQEPQQEAEGKEAPQQERRKSGASDYDEFEEDPEEPASKGATPAVQKPHASDYDDFEAESPPGSKDEAVQPKAQGTETAQPSDDYEGFEEEAFEEDRKVDATWVPGRTPPPPLESLANAEVAAGTGDERDNSVLANPEERELLKEHLLSTYDGTPKGEPVTRVHTEEQHHLSSLVEEPTSQVEDGAPALPVEEHLMPVLTEEATIRAPGGATSAAATKDEDDEYGDEAFEEDG